MMQLKKIIKYISYPETNIMIDTIKNYRLTLINLFNMKQQEDILLSETCT